MSRLLTIIGKLGSWQKVVRESRGAHKFRDLLDGGRISSIGYVYYFSHWGTLVYSIFPPSEWRNHWKRHMYKAWAFKEKEVIASLGEGKPSKFSEGEKQKVLTDFTVQHGQHSLIFLLKP